MFTDEYVNIISAIRQKGTEMSGHYPEKIYLSRSRWHQDKRDYGEPIIERYMQKEGFTVLSPEQLSIHQQIAYYAHCRHMVATEGSIAHNAVFCSPGTKLTILKKADYLNIYQFAIDDMLNLDVTYVEAHCSVFNSNRAPWAGPFFIYPTKLFMQSMGIKGSHCMWLNTEWWRYMHDHLGDYIILRITRPIKKLYRKIRNVI